MKTFLTLVVTSAIAICATLTSFATTRTVSNNPNIPAQYTSLQTAINDSSPGDTILVHGSPNSYGDISLGKSLVIIGPGYRPTGQSVLQATTGTFVVTAAAANANDNSVLIGISFGNLRAHGNSCNNGFAVKIFAERCRIESFDASNVAAGPSSSEIAINQSIISNFVASGFCGAGGMGSFSITNCIITGTFSSNFAGVSGIMANCIMLGGGAVLSTSQNTVFTNNIFAGPNLISGTKTGCTFANNLTFGTSNAALDYGGGNVTSGTIANTDPLFIAGPANVAAGQNTSTLFNFDLNLQPSSPAVNAATDGSNLGTSGGNTAYNYLTQGTPRGPRMLSLIINNPSLPEGGSLDVNIEAAAQD